MSVKDDRIFEIQRGTAPAWPSLLIAFIKEGRTGMRDKAKALTDALFSLEEPWRGRFLNLVANLATSWAWDGQPPTRKQVTNWLGTDLELYREMKLLLDAWHRPKK
jgi:hypothetical protein